MIAKLIVWGVTRDEAIRRARRALAEYRVRGIATNTAFFQKLLSDSDFISGEYDTGFLSAERMAAWPNDEHQEEVAVIAAAIAAYERDHKVQRPRASQTNGSPWRWSLR
jgi:acetyl-CoA carboxylase biotin carboxylase subunit